MVIITGMKMPKNCTACPFLYAGIGFASCMARAQYESPDGNGTFCAPRIWDGNNTQCDSSCPLYDDTAIDALVEEIKRLRGELERLTGACSNAVP